MKKDHYCIIMAGGIGSRFWPLSKTEKPKQFLDILGTGRTLLQLTFDRFANLFLKENILVVTNADYKGIVLEQLPEIQEDQVLSEPMRKNTAPCIAYANQRILRSNPDAVIVTSPADHLILKQELFLEEIGKALEFASRKDALLTLGIKPNRPETGYGYIQAETKPVSKKDENLRKVKTFTEKPDYDLACVFIESGEFFWNSGIFIWSLGSIMKAFEKYLPEVNSLFVSEDSYGTPGETAFINDVYATCPNISIDYGIMEKADNVYVLFSDFGWSDLGTWGSLYEHSEKDKCGNVLRGSDVYTYDVNNSIINFPDDKLVVLQGLKDFIVVESGNILLVCKKDQEQHIKQFVHDVKIRKGSEYV